MKIITTILNILLVIVLTACNDEGTNLDKQKQSKINVEYSGSNENWKVNYKMNGNYFNQEKLVQGDYSIDIVNTKNVSLEEPVTISIKDYEIKEEAKISEKNNTLEKENVTSKTYKEPEKISKVTLEIKNSTYSDSVTLNIVD